MCTTRRANALATLLLLAVLTAGLPPSASFAFGSPTEITMDTIMGFVVHGIPGILESTAERASRNLEVYGTPSRVMAHLIMQEPNERIDMKKLIHEGAAALLQNIPLVNIPVHVFLPVWTGLRNAALVAYLSGADLNDEDTRHAILECVQEASPSVMVSKAATTSGMKTSISKIFQAVLTQTPAVETWLACAVLSKSFTFFFPDPVDEDDQERVLWKAYDTFFVHSEFQPVNGETSPSLMLQFS
eukprot:ANDGO_08536.mRNA.1 hypothetical protein